MDNPTNLASHPVYIFGGTQDTLAWPINQQAQKDFFNNYGASPLLETFDTGHKVPTVFATGDDYVNGYDTIGAMYTKLLTGLPQDALSSLAAADNDYKSKGVLRRFSQKEFIDATIFQTIGMKEYGFVYYPYRCVDGTDS